MSMLQTGRPARARGARTMLAGFSSTILLAGILAAPLALIGGGCAGRSGVRPAAESAGAIPSRGSESRVSWSYPVNPEPPPSATPLYRLLVLEFPVNAAELDREAMGTLGLLIGRMVAEPKLRLLLVGFADKVGEAEKAQRLSEGRVKSTWMYLTRHSIREDRLETAGFGSTQAAGGAQDPEKQARDRRVEIWVLQE